MGWVRVDDAFYDNPKFIEVGPLGGWLYMRALAWCNRNLTDGLVPARQVPVLVNWDGVLIETWTAECAGGVDEVRSRDLAEKLVEVGLWDAVPGGYEIHDYLKYQPSAEQILAKRKKEAERGKRRRNGSSSSGASAPDSTPESAAPQPQPQESATHSRKSDLLFEAVCEVSGWSLSELTKDARGRANSAVKQLRELGASPDEVHSRALVYHQKYPDAALTPQALTGNWAALNGQKAALDGGCMYGCRHATGTGWSVVQGCPKHDFEPVDEEVLVIDRDGGSGGS